jgi:hypothetical protein
MGCVRPTCDDFQPLCNDKTDTGALARYLCGVTCGCDDLASDLLWIGPNSGCLPSCQEKAAKAAAEETCSDAQPGSAELAALVEYSRAFELPLTAYTSTSPTDRAELGCFTTNLEKWYMCSQEYLNATQEAKSLVPFCPVSCGCIGNPSKVGCPRACSAPEPPRLRDLSDAQLAVANKLAGKETMPYPPSCSGLNATVCDELLTASHKHPCPVVCGIDPRAASTSSALPPSRPSPPPPPYM